MSRITVAAFGPSRPWSRPGETVRVGIQLSATATVSAGLRLTLVDLSGELARVTEAIRLSAGSSLHELEIVLPGVGRRGYGLRLEVDDGSSRVEVSSAVEALDGWWESPRHAGITGFEDVPAAVKAIADLGAWHVNVVQHYDWMWRHYRYRPPDGEAVFVDALGRTVSHAAVRAAADAGRERGIASLAYGAVYGAEPEYVEEHPDERIFGADGKPLSLDGMFYITDLRPGSSWRERLLSEYEGAIADFAFDGIHMDTYGPPHTAVAADGDAIDFAALYPGLIEEAATRLEAVSPGTRVLFNCVDGFALDAVASTPTSCLYLELWPPDRSFADVVRWVDRSRAVADGRQVVIAAYAATLKDPDEAGERAARFEAVVLLGSFICAAGAYHHTLAEGDRLLVEGYYPAAVAMRPEEIGELRALSRFSARYVHLLSDPGILTSEPGDLEVMTRDGDPVRWTSTPEPGALWIRATTTPDGRPVLHTIDLRDQDDGYWDAPKNPSLEASGLRMSGIDLRAPVAASAWSRGGDAVPLEGSQGLWGLPSFRRWVMVTEPAPRR